MRTITRKRFAVTAILCAATLLACGGAQSTVVEENAPESTKPAAPLTPVLAKAHLADAAAEAKKWKSDAFLTQVSGANVSDDGKVASWQYVAYSPSAQKCLGIKYYRGKPSSTESGGVAACDLPPLGEIIDSNQAITVARENGVTKEVSMVAMASPTRPRESVWSVVEEGMRNPGNITVDIDASGKVVNTQKNP
jgi:hypothetical protein